MATLGWIEPKLAKCKFPKCAGCLYGKATHKPWLTKGTQNTYGNMRLASLHPGQVMVKCMPNRDGRRLSQNTYGHMPTTFAWRSGRLHPGQVMVKYCNTSFVAPA